MIRYLLLVCLVAVVCRGEGQADGDKEATPSPAVPEADAPEPIAPHNIDNTIDLLQKSLEHLEEFKRDLMSKNKNHLNSDSLWKEGDVAASAPDIPGSTEQASSDSNGASSVGPPVIEVDVISPPPAYPSVSTVDADVGTSSGGSPAAAASVEQPDGTSGAAPSPMEPPVVVARDIRTMTSSTAAPHAQQSTADTGGQPPPPTADDTHHQPDVHPTGTQTDTQPNIHPTGIQTDTQSQPNIQPSGTQTDTHIHLSGTQTDSTQSLQPPLEDLQETGSGHDIAPFNEWALKKVEETEKRAGEGVPTSGAGAVLKPATPPVRHRQKNYASPDCSAKVLHSNQEATSARNVLSAGRDEYMLNPCNARVWIVIELCEPVQVSRIEISNDELYSSSLQEFGVFFSDRYPTRDWERVGTFTADDRRGQQNFNISTNMLGKFLKVEVLSHYGTYYYCTMSSVRVFGASEYEVLDHQDAMERQQQQTETSDYEEPLETDDAAEKKPNLFDRAIEAVSTIVHSARRAFTTKRSDSEELCISMDDRYLPEGLSRELVSLISCSWYQLSRQLSGPLLTPARLRSCRLCEEPYIGCVNSGRCRLLEAVWHRQLQLLCVAARLFQLPIGPRPQQMEEQSCSDDETAGNQSVTSQKSVKSASSMSENGTTSESALQAAGSDADKVAGGGSSDASAASQHTHSAAKPASQSGSPAGGSGDAPAAVGSPSPAVDQGSVPSEDGESSLSTAEEETGEDTAVSTGAASVTGVTSADAQQPTAPQKESVFVRLNNRIRTLERNMSLSSQYLDELSRRYRRQVEDMQRTFNKTIVALEFTARDAEARDQLQQEMIKSLQIQLMDLTDVVKGLLSEKQQLTWTLLQRHAVLIVVELGVLCLAFALCLRHLTHCSSPAAVLRSNSSAVGVRHSSSAAAVRRRVPPPAAAVSSSKQQHKLNRHRRRASDEVVNITGTYSGLMVDNTSAAAATVCARPSTAARSTSSLEGAGGSSAGVPADPASTCAGVLFVGDRDGGSPMAVGYRTRRDAAAPPSTYNQYSALRYVATSPAPLSNGHGGAQSTATGRSKKLKQHARHQLFGRH